MEKNVKISMLCEIYGKLLTEKQLDILENYYDKDRIRRKARNYEKDVKARRANSNNTCRNFKN